MALFNTQTLRFLVRGGLLAALKAATGAALRPLARELTIATDVKSMRVGDGTTEYADLSVLNPVTPSFQYKTETGSTADSDPGVGLFKWNHATQSSATFLYFDDQTNGTSTDLSTLFTSLSGAPTGLIHIVLEEDRTKWQVWKWTAVTDGTGYWKFAITLQASSGSLADNLPVRVTFNALSSAAYTDEQAQDAVGTILTDSSTIDFTYTDATPAITASVIDDSITYGKMQNAAANTVIARAAGTSGDLGEVALAASRLLGRGSSGDIAPISLGSGLSMSGTSIITTGGVGGVGMTPLGSAVIAGSAASIITVSGLSLALYKSFFIIFSLKNATGSASNISLYYSGDTTAGNYSAQGLTVNNATLSGSRIATGIIDSLPASETTTGDIRISNDQDGRPRAFMTSNRDSAANLVWRCAGHRWATAADVTSISLSSAVANALAIGSRIDVYGNA